MNLQLLLHKELFLRKRTTTHLLIKFKDSLNDHPFCLFQHIRNSFEYGDRYICWLVSMVVCRFYQEIYILQAQR